MSYLRIVMRSRECEQSHYFFWKLTIEILPQEAWKSDVCPRKWIFHGCFPREKSTKKPPFFLSLAFTGTINPAQSKTLEHQFNLTLSNYSWAHWISHYKILLTRLLCFSLWVVQFEGSRNENNRWFAPHKNPHLSFPLEKFWEMLLVIQYLHNLWVVWQCHIFA